MPKKGTPSARQSKKKTGPKPQINVRMDQELFDLIQADAEVGEREPPAQVRLILKEYYKAQLTAKKR